MFQVPLFDVIWEELTVDLIIVSLKPDIALSHVE